VLHMALDDDVHMRGRHVRVQHHGAGRQATIVRCKLAMLSHGLLDCRN
jgi:hypothetical protein